MIVKLTEKQYASFGNYVPGDIAHLFTHDTWPSTDQTIAVRAPYVAWEIALEEISERTFTRSHKDPGDRKRLKSLLMRISKPMNIVLMHPSFKGVSMVGHETSVFCGWPIEPDRYGRRWLPSIRNEPPQDPPPPFEVLAPVWSSVDGISVTTWTPAMAVMAPPLWIYDRRLNEALSQRTALPALRPASPSAGPR